MLMHSIAKNELTPFLYYSQVYQRSLPNQLSDQQYHFVECMWRLSEDGCFLNFCTWGYCLVAEKVPNKHIRPMQLWWRWVPHQLECCVSELIGLFFIQRPPGKDGRDFSSLNLVKEFVNNSVTKGVTTQNLAKPFQWMCICIILMLAPIP